MNETLLKQAGFKITQTRLAIINLFSTPCKPWSAEEIFKKLNHGDLVTVYRTLTSFGRAGILKKVNLQKDSVYYELALHHHHHIVCTSCGSMEKFDLCGVEKITEKVLQKSSKFDSIAQHSLELFGVCKSCLKV